MQVYSQDYKGYKDIYNSLTNNLISFDLLDTYSYFSME